MSGSMPGRRGSVRFFHFEGVWDAVDANLEMGKEGLDEDGADVVNGWRGGGGGGEQGRFTRSCLSSRMSLRSGISCVHPTVGIYGRRGEVGPTQRIVGRSESAMEAAVIDDVAAHFGPRVGKHEHMACIEMLDTLRLGLTIRSVDDEGKEEAAEEESMDALVRQLRRDGCGRAVPLIRPKDLFQLIIRAKRNSLSSATSDRRAAVAHHRRRRAARGARAGGNTTFWGDRRGDLETALQSRSCAHLQSVFSHVKAEGSP